MVNGIRECAELCHKYTTLTDGEISTIYPYLGSLQRFAENTDSNVYIDCMTYTNTSMIIVGEAYPAERGTIYDKPLYGEIMYTKNEPAVARTFVTGQSTKNVTGEEVYSHKAMIQSVFPIKYGKKVVAVLIYERLLGDDLWDVGYKDPGSYITLPGYIEAILDGFDEALILVDKKDQICYYNKYSEKMLELLGYVGRIFGMGVENVITDTDEDSIVFNMRGYSFEGRIIRVKHRLIKYAVIINDITRRKQGEQELSTTKLLLREERHSTKNWLMSLADYAAEKSGSEADGAAYAYSDMGGRIRMLQAINEAKLRNGSKLDVTETLKYAVSKAAPSGLAGRDINVNLHGDHISVSADICNVIVTVIYEMLSNSLKYAFPDHTSGTIDIELKDELITATVTYKDNGQGFDTSKQSEGNGLRIIRTLVHDKLGGEFRLESGPEGTTETFSFIK
jgi:two-component sensor histidine kinase